MNSELLPCPFCGSQPLSIDHFRNGLKLWVVFCHVGEMCSMDTVSAIGIDEDDATQIWNTRAPIPKQNQMNSDGGSNK